MQLKRIESETEEQMLWRLGQAKDSGLIEQSWDEIADVMNREFRAGESEYRTSSAYRKYYQYARNFFNAGVFKDKDDKAYADELSEIQQEIRKTKQQLFDERTALNRQLRHEARIDNDLSYLVKLIQDNAFSAMPPCPRVQIDSDTDMIICISDLHFGIECDTAFGCYSPEKARDRMSEYCSHIREIQEKHNCQNAYVLLLGDLLSGDIHHTIQLENRENVVEQIKGAAEMIASFIHSLSGIFENVTVNGVAGNHSRLSFKDEVLRGERLDNLIPWYLKAALSHVENVQFTGENNYDATICNIDVRDNEYLGVHGDFDAFSESGVSKLVMMLGHKPAGIFYGHMHHNSFDDICGVKIIRSGSLAGTGDNYAIQKRLYGQPGQMVAIAGYDGIEAMYPIDLAS